VLDMPADGLEPWGSDAWTLFVATGAVLAISLLLGTSAWALPVFLLGLIAALALRLRTAVEDVIRIEIEPGEWSVHAVEGGRVVHCHGRGLLLPELLPHALLLWSETGRIGTLRWELEPEERAWLAERLLAAAHACKSGPSERRHEVDEEEPDEHRQEEQGENERWRDAGADVVARGGAAGGGVCVPAKQRQVLVRRAEDDVEDVARQGDAAEHRVDRDVREHAQKDHLRHA